MSDQNPNQSANQASISRHANPEDLALFTMQLLSGEEAAAIAQHVEHCAECRRELGLLQNDLGAYAFTVEMNEPRAQARQQLLRQVAREKKVVPISSPAIAAYGRSNSLFGAVEEVKPKRSIGRVVIVGGAGWAIAAGLAVATTFLYKDRNALHGAVGAQSSQIARLTADAANSHQLMDALTDSKALRVTLTAKPAPHAPIGRATYNADKGTLIFLASDLDPLQLYKTYELWLLPADGSAPIPAGTFHPDEQGNASLIMPELPKGIAAKGFGVTIEDDGGSQTPTKPIVLAGF
jgi:Anti-sigma-K factor rskA